MKIKDSQGFAVLECLLILVIIAIIGGTGYYVWHSKQQTESSLNNASVSNQTVASENKKTSQTNDLASPQKYLTIKEVGVKFQLSDAIKDAYYAKNGKYYYFSLHKFDNLKGAEGCRAETAEGGSLGIVALVNAKVGDTDYNPDGSPATQEQLDSSGLKKIGNVYYGFMGGNAPCWNVDNPPSSNFIQTINDIKQEFYKQQSTFTNS